MVQPRMYKFVINLILITGLSIIFSCNKQTEHELEPNLNGSWIWIKSFGGVGGWTLTPKNQNYSKTMVIDGHRYREFINENFAYESDFNYQLLIDSLNGNKWLIDFGGFSNALITLNKNTLELNETCFDCYNHTFIRKLKIH